MVLKHLLVSTTSLGNVTSPQYMSAAHCLLGVTLQQKHLSERELLLHCQSTSSRQTGHIFCKRNFQLHLSSHWLMIPDLVKLQCCSKTFHSVFLLWPAKNEVVSDPVKAWKGISTSTIGFVRRSQIVWTGTFASSMFLLFSTQMDNSCLKSAQGAKLEHLYPGPMYSGLGYCFYFRFLPYPVLRSRILSACPIGIRSGWHSTVTENDINVLSAAAAMLSYNPLPPVSTLYDFGKHHHVQTRSTNNSETETGIDAISRATTMFWGFQARLCSNRRHPTSENSVTCELPVWGTVSTSGFYLILFSEVGYCRHAL